jgi:tRNA(fMet)-specific endonuclease VapC
VKVLLDAGTLAAMLRGRLEVVLQLSRRRPVDIALPMAARMQVEISLQSDPRAQARYSKLLREFIDSVRVIEFGEVESEAAARVGSYLASSGERIGAIELMNAGTALAHQRTLVAERTAPYRAVPGLAVESWLEQR